MFSPSILCAFLTFIQRSNDGLTLLITSSDGFCSTLSFSPSELGQIYQGDVPTAKHPVPGATPSSNQNTPIPTPTSVFAPPSPFPTGPSHQHRNSASSFAAPSPPLAAGFANARPTSPARSNSTSSVATQSSAAQPVATNPSLIIGSVPSITATNSAKVTGVPITTPPETPGNSSAPAAGVKREASSTEQEGSEPKKRRIAPTLVLDEKKP